MNNSTPGDIHLARSGQVTCRNYVQLGYQRIAHGVYGRVPSHSGQDEYERRHNEFMSRTRAVMVVYRDKGAVLYGTSGLRVLGVSLPERLDDWHQTHILVRQGVTRPVRHAVVVHWTRTTPTIWRRMRGLPVLHPVEHWTQLRGATDDELIEVADGFVRRQHPLLTMDEIRQTLAVLSGRPGAARAQRVLKWVRPGTDSIYETRLRMVLVRGGLPVPVVNHDVYVGAIDTTYHVDMAYVPEKIGVEYDGSIHAASRAKMEQDAIRRRLLQDEGWMIITVTATQLMRTPQQVVRSVESALVLRRAALNR